MVFLDVLYVSLSTIAIMIVLQLLYMAGIRLITPHEPKVVYREVPVYKTVEVAPPVQQPVFTQQRQDVVLPEYEPRKQASDGLRLDAGLPDGIQETRPIGT